jgi:hypothetical protein
VAGTAAAWVGSVSHYLGILTFGQALATARELGLANVERDAVALLQDCP